MKVKNDVIEGEIYVVGKDLFDAVASLDGGDVYGNYDAAYDAKSWVGKVYRVEVKIYEA